MTFRPNTTKLAAASLLIASSLILGGCETLDQFITPGTKVDIRGERISVLPKAAAVETDPKLANEAVKLPKPVVNSE